MRINRYNIELLPNGFLARSERACQLMTQAERITHQGGTVGYPAWNLLYYAALTTLPTNRPSVVVETGTSYGLTTVILAQAVSDCGGGIVHTIESQLKRVGEARENIRQAGLAGIVEFHIGDSSDILQRLAIPHIDFVFIDGCHELLAVIADFEAILPAIKKVSGTVAFDNSNSGPVNDAIKTLTMKYGGNLVRFRNCSWCPPGIAIWQP